MGLEDLLVLPDRASSGPATSCSRGSTSASACCCRSSRATSASAADVRDDRTGLGRQRGLARGRRRRDLRGVPGLVRDDVLRLLPRAAADPRAADRARASRSSGARSATARAGGPAGCGRTRSRASAPPFLWGVALANLIHGVPLDAEARLHRQRPRPVQPLHRPRRDSPWCAVRAPRRDLPHAATSGDALRASGRDGAGGCAVPAALLGIAFLACDGRRRHRPQRAATSCRRQSRRRSAAPRSCWPRYSHARAASGWAFAMTGARRDRLRRDDLHRPVSARARLPPGLREQPHDRQRRGRALRAVA